MFVTMAKEKTCRVFAQDEYNTLAAARANGDSARHSRAGLYSSIWAHKYTAVRLSTQVLRLFFYNFKCFSGKFTVYKILYNCIK